MEKIKKIPSKSRLIVIVYHNLIKISKFPSFLKDFIVFKKEMKKDMRFPIKIRDLFPCLLDKTISTSFEPHYLYHTAWAARKLKNISPEKHIDISSTLNFCTIVSAFIPTEFYDYRPVDLGLSNLKNKKGDLMNLPFETNSVDSLSCMHTIEHIGLGRYGDKIDATGDIKAAKELSRVLKPHGKFIFVAPIGKPKIEFNAHRIYSYEQVLNLFPDLNLIEFSMVPDDFKKYKLIENANSSLVKEQKWACGCFLFEKQI